MSEEDKKGQLTNQVKTASESLSTSALKNAGDNAKDAVTNAGQNISGQIAGQVTGGIESLTQKVDSFKGEVTKAKDTVEGLLSGDTTSLKNMGTDMVNSAVAGLLSKFGAKVEVSFSEPDSHGIVTPISASLDAEGGVSDTVTGILSLITGLGASFPPNPAELAENFKGNLQKIVTDASPKGLLNAGKDLAVGKIGAFDGASVINDLASKAVKSVTDELISTVGPALAASSNLNKTITPYALDGSGNVIPGTPESNPNFVDETTEFNAAMQNMIDGVDTDLPSLISKSNEITQDLKGAKSDLENLSGGTDGDTVLKSVQGEAKTASAYSKSVNEYKSLVATRVSGNSETGIIQGLSTNVLTNLRKRVKDFCSEIPEEDIDKVIALSQGDAADKQKAAETLKKNCGKTYNEVINFMRTINSTITASTKPQVDQVIFSDPYIIGSYGKTWDNGKGNPEFPYISSVEELEGEIQFINREVEAIIVHWTETHTDKNIGSEEINDYHLQLGMNGIGYHYVIRRDGSLQRGRPVHLEGEHTPTLDATSIGIVFVGGINAPVGTPNSENFLSSQSLTRSQINTFDHFCRSMYKVKPGILFYGHSDVDFTGENIDPGFDVPDYVLTRFGKENKAS